MWQLKPSLLAEFLAATTRIAARLVGVHREPLACLSILMVVDVALSLNRGMCRTWQLARPATRGGGGLATAYRRSCDAALSVTLLPVDNTA